jgi:PAS domain S-box-containing protein
LTSINESQVDIKLIDPDSPTEKSLIEAAQIQQLYHQADIAVFGATLTAVCLLALLWHVAEHWKLFIWLGVTILVYGLRLWGIIAFRRVQIINYNPIQWKRLFNLGSLASGLTLASSAIFIFPEESQLHQMAWALVLAGLSTAAMASHCPVRSAYLSFMIPTMSSVAFRFFYEGMETYINLGLLTLIYMLFLVEAGNRLNKSNKDSLRLRFENQGLLGYLKKQQTETERLNEELMAEIVERKKAEADLLGQKTELDVRVSELNCLYSISNLASRRETPVEQTVQQIVNLMAISCPYPASVCSRITLDSKSYVTPNFKETADKQEIGIFREGNRIGSVELFRIDPIIPTDSLFAYRDHCRVLAEIAERIGLLIQYNKAETSLRESESKYKEMTELLPLFVYEIDLDGHFTYINKSGIEASGYSSCEILDKLNVLSIVVPEDRNRIMENVRKIINGETGFASNEYRVIRKNGTTFPAISYSAPAIMQGKIIGIIGACLDITALRQAEHEILKGKETVEALLNATQDMAFLLDKKGKFLAVNETLANRLGKQNEELLGEPAADFSPTELMTTITTQFSEVIETGRPLRFQENFGSRIYDHNFYPVFGSDGTVENVAVFSRDITEQKMAQDLFLQNERIKAVGEMAAGVAHNFNNLLQIVAGSSQMALAHLQSGSLSVIEKCLDQIVQSSKFGAETVKRLQNFARIESEGQVKHGEVFDLSTTANQAIEFSSPWWKATPEKEGIKIFLNRRLSEGCLVNGQENEIFEVLVNLIKNAVESMPLGGEINLTTRMESNQVIVQVQDTGSGIANGNLSKVFQPFWTTKGFQGTGMGLASSYGIVKAHGGEIVVDSKIGTGSTFTVTFPLARESIDIALELESEFAECNFTILVIDDVEPILILLRDALENYGQKVFTAQSGSQGLDIFANNPVDLVICDLGMQGMNGWQVGKAIRSICEERGISKTPFLLLTGWANQLREQDKISDSGIDAIVEKPVDIGKLLHTARRVVIGDHP